MQFGTKRCAKNYNNDFIKMLGNNVSAYEQYLLKCWVKI